MSVGLLGPLLMDGGRAALSPRDRVVLAALGCCPGEAISPESLAEAVWGDEQPASWLKVLQGSVMRLRRAMGSDAIEWTGTGYRLTLAGDELDTAHFERLVARGRSLVAVGEPARAVVAFDEALTLWRGAPFEDLAHWSPGQAAAVRLAEVRRAVEEERLAAALMCGRALELTGQAQLLVTQEPYRENRWALLAQTLYASGRQAEALAAVRHATTTLRDELGLDPSPALAELEQAILRHDPALVERLNPTARSAASCPYKGLAPYEGEDADGFFGREADQSECLRQLGTGRLLVVLGPSGSGKSSLVRAGIVPTLRRAGQRMVLLTPGPRPAEALSAALAGAPRGSGLVVDQLEELFTGRQGTDVARDFLDRLTQFVVSSGPVVVTLRADYVGGLTVSAGFARLMSTGVHLVTAMTEEQVRRAIEEPARHAGLLLEPGLVDVLVRDVLDEPGGLPLLSHALVETWERREGDVLTVDGYRASGGIRGAVAQSAEQLYESLDDEARRRLRAVLLRLVTPSATGDPVGARVPTRVLRGDQTEDLLDLLIRARLVTADSDSATIAHESLATAWPRLRTWLDEDVEGQRVFAHLQVAADGWDATGRPDSELYRGARLQVAREWRARTAPALAPVEDEFLAASDEREQSERREERRRLEQQVRLNRRLRRLLAGVAALLVLAIVATVTTFVARDHARTAEGKAAREVVQTLATQLDASSVLEPRADTALLLARQAVELADTPQTRGGLLRALDDSHGLLRSLETVGGATIASELKLSPDGRRLLAYKAEGTFLIDTATGATIPPGRPLARGTWGPVWMNPAGFVDGGRTAVLTRFTTTGKGPHPVQLLAFSTTTGRAVRPPEPIPGAVGGDFFPMDRPHISPDGRHLVSSTDGQVRVWLRRGSGWVGPRTARIPGIPLGLGPAVDRVGFSADGRRALLRIEVQGVPPFYVTPFFSVVVDTSTGRLLTPVFGTAAAPVAQGLAIAALSPDGSRLAVADRSGRVDIHPVGAALNQDVVRLVGRSPGSSLGWDPSGRTVVVGREDGSVETFDARTADHRSDFPGHDKPLLVSQFTEDGRMLVTLDDGGLLLAHATRPGSVVSTVVPVPRPHAIATGPTGSVLAVGLENGHVALFDQRRLSRLPVDLWLGPYAAGDTTAAPAVHRRVTALALTPDGSAVVAGDRLGHLRMWSVPDGRLLWSQDDVPVSFLAVSPDGRYVATAGFTQPADDPAPDGGAENSSVTLRDLRVGHQVAVRGTGQRKPAAIAFSPDSRTLAVGFFEDTADVLDGRTLARQATMPQSATAVAFAPDGHQLLAVAFDGTVTAYEKPDWRAAASFRTNADGHVHLAYSTGGQFLLISDARATSLWDADRHKLIAEPLSLQGDGTNDALFLAPVPETDVVYLASQTALARLDMNPARWRRQACFLAGRRLTRDEWRRYLPDLSYRPACGSTPPVPVPPS